ncbi:MAG: response regulator [Spirochaetales bacterium]|nr:response regulator [Spirochaetales bacterium]
MSESELMQKKLPLFGRYIEQDVRRQRIIIVSVVFIVFEIIRIILLIFLKQSIFLCLSIVPIALSGLLLGGVFAPILTGLLADYITSVVILYAQLTDYYIANEIYTAVMIFFGIGIGVLADCYHKAKLIERTSSPEGRPYYKEIPLWGKYLSEDKRKNRLIIFIIMLICFAVIQMVLQLYIKRGIIFSLNLIPVAISGWLLGTYAPIITGLLANYYNGIIMEITNVENTEFLIGILIMIITIIIGCFIGKLSELIRHSRITADEIKKAKEEAERANRAKSEFLACMSHEIRTPMNSILGFAQLLKEEIVDPRYTDKINIILKSGKTLLTLINDILDISKIEAGEIELMEEEFYIRHMFMPLENIFSFKAKEKNLEFAINIDSSMPEYLIGDECRIQQIVSNLISNAVKFTDKGAIIINASYVLEKLVIDVIDTGIGIPADKLEIVFTMFKRVDPSLTREYSGTGLGLAIAKRLIEKMNGSITVESSLKKGTCFTIKLPLTAATMKKKKKAKEKSDSLNYTAETIKLFLEQDNSCNVLVAEDNESNRMYISELLKRAGIDCDFAIDGKQTIDMLERKANTHAEYDLVFLDIQMPVLSGLDVITYIRNSENLNRIYCIAVTAHALKEDEQKYLNAGCDAYISKPIQSRELYKHITYMLEKKRHFHIGDASSSKQTHDEKIIIPDIIEINESQKSQIIDLIEKLKNNYKLYNKQELELIRKKSRKILPEQILRLVEPKIENSLKTYDDEILLDIIELLEIIINKGPLSTPS